MNPELEAAEKTIRQEDQDARLLELRDEDLRKIERVALSGFNVPLDLVYALCRESVRLRREVDDLKKKIGGGPCQEVE